MRKLSQTSIFGISLMCVAGCASGFGSWSSRDPATSHEACARPQIERGKPNVFVDSVGWMWGIPQKVILWDLRIDNHRISPETEAAIAQYVDETDLSSTKVRINQYAPIDEWRRLTANHEVSWGWRYTLGALTWLEEAILPGRIFGTDHYNAYTNTISIFSDAPAIAIKEGSRARDVRSRNYPGTYAAVNSLPLVSMWYETVATKYAFEYIESERPDVEEEGYHLLYPAYGAHLGSDLVSFTYLPTLIGAAVGSIPGHIIGRYQAPRDDSTDAARAQSVDTESR